MSAACELAQMKAIDLDVKTKYPKTHAWFERMLSIPEMAAIHDIGIPRVTEMRKVSEAA